MTLQLQQLAPLSTDIVVFISLAFYNLFCPSKPFQNLSLQVVIIEVSPLLYVAKPSQIVLGLWVLKTKDSLGV